VSEPEKLQRKDTMERTLTPIEVALAKLSESFPCSLHAYQENAFLSVDTGDLDQLAIAHVLTVARDNELEIELMGGQFVLGEAAEIPEDTPEEVAETEPEE